MAKYKGVSRIEAETMKKIKFSRKSLSDCLVEQLLERLDDFEGMLIESKFINRGQGIGGYYWNDEYIMVYVVEKKGNVLLM